MKRAEFWTATSVAVGLLLGILYVMDRNETGLRTEMRGLRIDVREDLGRTDGNINRLRAEVREDLGRMDGNVNRLRADVREDLGRMDDNIGGLRTETTRIAEDVGYLRGRQDERDRRDPGE